jgi:hypothetical protein
MAVGNITTTTAANFIPEIWSPECKVAREANLVAAKTVNRDYEGEIREYGDTVHITDISNLTAREKEASTDVTYETITEGVTNLTINKHKYAAFKLEDIVGIQSRVDLRAKYTQKVGYALAKEIDTDVLAMYSGFSQTVGSVATDITDPTLLAAIEYLDLADAPAGDRSLILYPTQMNAMLNIDKFVRADAVGYLAQMSPVVTGHLAKGSFSPADVKGYFGQVYGVDVYVSTNVPRTGTSPISTHNVLWHKDALVLALQRDVRTQADYDIDALATKVVADVLYGIAELRDNHAVRILT